MSVEIGSIDEALKKTSAHLCKMIAIEYYNRYLELWSEGKPFPKNVSSSVNVFQSTVDFYEPEFYKEDEPEFEMATKDRDVLYLDRLNKYLKQAGKKAVYGEDLKVTIVEVEK